MKSLQKTLAILFVGLALLGTGLLTGCRQETDTIPQTPEGEGEPVASDTAASPDTSQEPDVPYVPTSNESVTRMLELADVGEDDVVYDLGSGDGRIVIAAAQKFGARGVGIEIDSGRVQKARQNAKEAGVADMVEFRRGDLFEADLSDATVVTLYLLPSVNMKLRPKLLKELEPGTPIVSHDFDMDDWEPEQTVKVGNDTIYLWRVPEDPSDLMSGSSEEGQ